MDDDVQFTTLVDELRTLVQKARARGDRYPCRDFQAHYWFGVAVAYEDAADRLNAVLSRKK